MFKIESIVWYCGSQYMSDSDRDTIESRHVKSTFGSEWEARTAIDAMLIELRIHDINYTLLRA
jgi:hypothetical protein